MIRNIAMFLFLLVPTLSHAQLDSQFTFNGQNAEILKAEKKVTVVETHTVQVPSTCYRQVPAGQREVCRDVTRSREVCSTIPSSQRCWTDNERVCRPVTRTRQECSGGGSHEVCTDTPPRTVCTERPTRTVCRTNPANGRETCSTVGGGQVCNQVGGGRTCHSVPRQPVCRTVSYTDQECHSVPRQRCETIPSRRECRDVPYSDTVCGMETQYRSESYACTDTREVSRNVEKTIKAEIHVAIITNGLVEEFPIAVSLKEANSDLSSFAIEAKLLKEPKSFVVLQRKEVKIASASESEIVLKGSIVLEVLSKEMLPISFPVSVASASIEAATKKLIIVLEGGISPEGSVDLEITHKSFLSRQKTIAKLKADYPSKKVELGVVDNKAALSIDLSEAMQNQLQKKNMKLKLNLSSKLNLRGELMNTTKPETTKLYEGTFVQLK